MRSPAPACGDDDAEEGAGSDDTASDGTAADGTTSDVATSDATGADDAEPVTIGWWHIQNNDPGLSNWQAIPHGCSPSRPSRWCRHRSFYAFAERQIVSGLTAGAVKE